MTKNQYASIKTIIYAGLLAGALDILAAFADYYIATGKGPEGVLRFIPVVHLAKMLLQKQPQ
jgi:hypothetical protein